ARMAAAPGGDRRSARRAAAEATCRLVAVAGRRRLCHQPDARRSARAGPRDRVGGGGAGGRAAREAEFMNPIAVGPVPLPNRVLLAPMSGVTDAPFRRMAADLGAGLVISEMTACAALAEGKRIARKRAQTHGSGPHVVQLAGCEARWMAEGARIAEGLGADIIDINMGCPAKHVTNGASGSALMRDLDHALTLIEAVVGAVRVPV